jgi:hypothetical protein
MFTRLVVDLLRVETVLPASGVLGAVQRLIGLRQQRIGAVASRSHSAMPMLTPMRTSLPSMTYGAETISINFSANVPAADESVTSA